MLVRHSRVLYAPGRDLKMDFPEQFPFNDISMGTLEPEFLVGGGRFTLKKRIGFGSFSVSWLALDEHLGEEVALKFFAEQITSQPGVLDMLRREAQRSRKLAHPNIVRIHDFISSTDEPAFLAMEYVAGSNMNDLRIEQADQVFAWDYLKPLIVHACAALAYAHNEGFVHGDIKPTNFILDERGRLKLADFGLSRLLEENVKQLSDGISAQKLYYRSPQALRALPPTVGDDIYSLGATIYELLCGKPPFWTGDIAHQIQNSRAQPLAERFLDLGIPNQVPSHIATLVLRCLCKSPSERPATVEDVGRQIENPAAAIVPQGAESPSEVISLVPPVTERIIKDRTPDPWDEEDRIPRADESPTRNRVMALGIVLLLTVITIYVLKPTRENHSIPNQREESDSHEGVTSPVDSMEPPSKSGGTLLKTIQAGSGPAFSYRYSPRERLGPDTNAINVGVRYIHEGPENYHASYLVPAGTTNNSVGTITYDIRPDPGFVIQDLDLSQTTALYTRGRIRGEYSLDFGQTYREFFSSPPFQGKSFGYGRTTNLTSLNATNVILRYILHRYDGADYKLQFLRDSDDGPVALQISGSVIRDPQNGAITNDATGRRR
jgi:serine/threonine protein kinase